MALKSIRRLYITLHKNTSSSPTLFSTTTNDGDRVLDNARSYPRCRIDGHHHPTPALSPAEVPVLPPTFYTPRASPAPTPPFTLFPNSTRPVLQRLVSLDSFNPGFSWPDSRSVTPPPLSMPRHLATLPPSDALLFSGSTLPGVSPSVSVSPMALDQYIPAAIDENVETSSTSSPTSSLLLFPSPQESPDSATMSMSTPPDDSTFLIDTSSDTPSTLKTTPVPLPSQTTPVTTPLSASSGLMLFPAPSFGADAGVGVILKFNGYGEFLGLLCHSPHSVVYEEDLYPTALHLFEARKFLDHRPDLADRLRKYERVEEVTTISAELEEYVRRDWGSVVLSTVSS
jgi:hypothetical protein